MLSPTLFNVFIDDLLQKLHKMNTGVRLGVQHFGSFAYADDVTLISAPVPGLQRMIDARVPSMLRSGVCFLIQQNLNV